jgi:hypothetical protein
MRGFEKNPRSLGVIITRPGWILMFALIIFDGLGQRIGAQV